MSLGFIIVSKFYNIWNSNVMDKRDGDFVLKTQEGAEWTRVSASEV